MIQEDTICAVSTAAGEAGIGVIRISGKDTIEIVDKIFKAVFLILMETLLMKS